MAIFDSYVSLPEGTPITAITPRRPLWATHLDGRLLQGNLHGNVLGLLRRHLGHLCHKLRDHDLKKGKDLVIGRKMAMGQYL